MARKSGSFAQTTAPKVRAAALRLFAQHGYAAVSMRQIAAEVGMQAGALYSYTPDKQSLLFDLMRGHMEALLAARAAKPAAGDAVAQLDAFTRFHIQYHLERVDAVFVSYMELRNLTPQNYATVTALRAHYEAQLTTIIQDGVEAGQFQVADAKIAALAIIAMLTGLTTWFQAGGRLPQEDIERIYVDLVRGAVGVT